MNYGLQNYFCTSRRVHTISIHLRPSCILILCNITTKIFFFSANNIILLYVYAVELFTIKRWGYVILCRYNIIYIIVNKIYFQWRSKKKGIYKNPFFLPKTTFYWIIMSPYIYTRIYTGVHIKLKYINKARCNEINLLIFPFQSQYK